MNRAIEARIAAAVALAAMLLLDTDTTEDMRSETGLLQQGHWQIEAMAHLDEVPATGSLLVVSWPKPAHGLGFPAPAFAILP
jgi:kynurenine formamidase